MVLVERHAILGADAHAADVDDVRKDLVPRRIDAEIGEQQPELGSAHLKGASKQVSKLVSKLASEQVISQVSE